MAEVRITEIAKREDTLRAQPESFLLRAAEEIGTTGKESEKH